MNSGNKSYADILKGTYAGLNPKLDVQKVVKKSQRVRLSESAKSNLRAAINGEAMVKSDKATNPVVSVYEPVKTLMEMTRPLVLASASAGILPNFVMDERHFMQSSVNSAGVRLLKPNELVDTFREGKKENPIDVCDSDHDEDTKGFGQLREIEMQPMYELDEVAKNSDFNQSVNH